MRRPFSIALMISSGSLLGITGCGGSVSVDPILSAAAEALRSDTAAEEVREVGDGLAARRARVATVFPEVETLVAAGTQGAAAVVPRFDGQPDIDADESLFVYAYVLEQVGDASVVPDLVAFLERNATGEVPAALSSATHAVRVLQGSPTDPTAAYLPSEIGETIDSLDGESSKDRFAPLQQATGAQESCGGEFYLLDANGDRIIDASGKEIRVGGTLFNPSVDAGFAASSPGTKLAARVVNEGGTPFDYTDPQSGDTFAGMPSRRFNCAGFAFRHFVGGKQWIADPARMFKALNDASLLAPVDASDVQPGDFAFFTQEGVVAHVAEVETADTGLLGSGITVINADGPSGMFRANVTAMWYQKYGGVTYHRWRNGQPRFEAVSDLKPGTGCFEVDLDGDGLVELTGSTTNCTPGGNCNIECVFDTDCPEGQACNDRFLCYSPDDVECFFDGQCPEGQTCDGRFQCSGG